MLLIAGEASQNLTLRLSTNEGISVFEIKPSMQYVRKEKKSCWEKKKKKKKVKKG